MEKFNIRINDAFILYGRKEIGTIWKMTRVGK